MKTGGLPNRLLAVALTLLSASAGQGADPEPVLYSAAAYASDGLDVNSRLIIFRSDRAKFSIPLPLTLQYIAFGASGKSLFAAAFGRIDARSGTTLPGLWKIDLDPVRVSAIPGLGAFYAIDRFAVSRREDTILFSGTRRDGGGDTCGVFELTLPDGNLRSVLTTTTCSAGSPWRVFDISPNVLEALISADRSLALLDLAHGKITPLGGMISQGAYSPNGKWIAVVGVDKQNRWRTSLIEREDVSRRRELGESGGFEVAWSPDSRFVLQAVNRPACPSQDPTALETLDVETGKKFTIKNSICNAGGSNVVGWVSSKIGR